MKGDDPDPRPTDGPEQVASDDRARSAAVAADPGRPDRAAGDAPAAGDPESRAGTVMIGIPAYNEADSVGDVVRAALDRAGREIVDFDISRTSLEEVFVDMTREGGSGQEAAEAVAADGGVSE